MTDYIKTDRLELTGIVKHNGLNLSFIEPKLNLTYSCNYRELKLNKSNLKVSHFSLDLSFYDNKQNDYINQYIHIGNHKFKIRIDEEPFFYIQNDSSHWQESDFNTNYTKENYIKKNPDHLTEISLRYDINNGEFKDKEKSKILNSIKNAKKILIEFSDNNNQTVFVKFDKINKNNLFNDFLNTETKCSCKDNRCS